MSPKPVDIDTAVELLKADGSTPEMRHSARQNFGRPRVIKVLPKLSLVGVAATATIFLIWPRATAGRTWAQALQSSTQAKIMHTVAKGPKGNVRLEAWRQDKKMAVISYTEKGSLSGEMRSNGERVFSYYTNLGLPETVGKNVNARRFGMLHKDDLQVFKNASDFQGRLDQFLNFYKYEVVGQESISTATGAATRYELKEKLRTTEHEFVTVDSKSGLIVKVVSASGKSIVTYDYPEAIDQAVFEPTPKIVKNCDIYNWLDMRDQLQKTVESGIASANGVTLRLVALDSRGNLWAIWTGKNVAEDVKHPFTATGLQLGKPWGLPKVSTGGPHYIYGPEVMRNGERLYGLVREAKTKVGDTVDIAVPIKGGGFVKFKSVPVMRVGLYEPSYFVPKKNIASPAK